MSAQERSEQISEHQQAAKDAEAREDFATAAREYALLAKWLPGSAEVESNLGVALYFNHDLERAVIALHQAITLNQQLYAPHLFLGLTKYHQSQTDAAVQELRKAVAINASDPLAQTWLAYAYIAQSDYPEAVEHLETAAAQQPGNVDVAYALGQCYLELGRQSTTRLLKASPDGGRTWQLAAEQAEAQGKREKALSMYLAAYKRRPDIKSLGDKIAALNGSLPETSQASAVAPVAEDALYEQVASYEQKSKAAFERLTAIDPDSYRAHQFLADSYVVSDHFDDAIPEYKMVLERKPDLPGIHGALCNVFSRLAQVQEAVAECGKEIVLTPYSAEAHVQAARVYILTENYAKAEVLLRKAVQLDRPPAAAYKYLGQVLLDQKQYGAAAKDLSKYLAAEPRDSSAYYLLSRAYKFSGDTQRMQEAIAAYKKSSDAAKNASEAQRSLDAAQQKESLDNAEENSTSQSTADKQEQLNF